MWRGVPVTDEALTQCIKTLRRQLGDDAGNPRFIETIPKHGYRFIAPVEAAGDAVPAPPRPQIAATSPLSRFTLLGAAGTLGAGIAGAIGGLIYGFAATSQSVGAVSVLLVLICLTVLVALMGGAGVAFGIAAAQLLSGKQWQWSVLGGAAGGMIVGAIVKLLGLDAFNLLLGHAPGAFAGGLEGALLGGAVGLGGWLAHRRPASLRRRVAIAAAAGGVVGALVPLAGGRLMAGSLDSLARSFPDSRLRLDHVGSWFGESGFGLVSQSVTGCLEGALFSGCVVGAMILALRDEG
ncbi:MAG: transcriptional regulator [Sphingomonadales bacterium]|nr:MAG: transcriptional regulator [Sphingomonadales bacterium]